MEEFEVWKLRDNLDKYQKLLNQCIEVTPYHSLEYLLAEEKAENYPLFIFFYKNQNDFALYPLVIRRINDLPYMCGLQEVYYDLITPHEYGGIISNNYACEIKQTLLNELERYSKNHNILCQFARINPYFGKLPELYKEAGFHVIHSDCQVYIDLSKSEQELFTDCRTNTKNQIRQGERANLVWNIEKKSKENIDIFVRLYNATMENLGACSFLRFNSIYFDMLIKAKNSEMVFVRNQEGTVLAAAILLLCNEYVYYHLSCSNKEFLYLRPVNFLIYGMINWSKNQGYKILHLGGGKESLRHFKAGFSKNRIDYYIAEKIYLNKEYESMESVWKEKFPQYIDNVFFPIYRFKEG